MSFEYQFQCNIGSDIEITDENLIGMGVEIHQCIISYLKAKRVPAKLVGELDIAGGRVCER